MSNYPSHPRSSHDDSNNQSSVPSSSHTLFPPTQYSPLINPHPNPFEQLCASRFQQRSNRPDSYPVDSPVSQRPSSPVDAYPYIHNGSRGLAIEVSHDARTDIELSDGWCEWPASQAYQPSELDMDIHVDDEGLSTLDRIYLFCNSKTVVHRAFIARTMPSFLSQITPQDAVDYVIPLLNSLATDEDETAQEAFAAELINTIWWFLINCRVIEDEHPTFEDSGGPSAHPTDLPTPKFSLNEPDWTTRSETSLSVHTFTPILGSLLLSPNKTVAESARGTVVELLQRMRLADGKDGLLGPGASQEEAGHHKHRFYTNQMPLSLGLFQRNERDLFERELLYQVVIGVGRLDKPQLGAYDNEPITDGFERQAKSPLLDPNPRLPSEKSDSYFLEVPHKSLPRNSAPSHVPGPDNITVREDSDSVTELHSEDSPSQGSEFSTPELSPGNSEASVASPSDNESAYRYLLEGSHASGVPSDDQTDNHWLSQEPEAKMLFPSPRQGVLPLHTPSQDDEERGNWAGRYPGKDVHQSEVPDIGYQGGETLDRLGGDDGGEQAAVGRLTSMSLMAAIAASSSLAEDTKITFVKDVERVGQDPVFLVRREASYALGALAKVVPAEIVVSSLLPLLESLYQDSVWNVRLSALYALPAILPRLSPEKRRTVALNAMLPLAEDLSSSVRVGVLEVLGEVLYTFQKDEDVPQELLDLFIGQDDGQTETDSSDGGEQPSHSDFDDDRWPDYPSWALGLSSTNHDYGEPTTIWNDASRPLICAFNYPAVVLTLGRDRWAELRDLYRSLSRCSQFKVKLTLAASLGELAKIIGPDNARTDLLDVFRASIKSDEGEVRLKVIEALEVFLAVVSDESKWDVVEMLSEAWVETHLTGWRERESVLRLMGVFIELETDVSDASQWNRGAQLLKLMLMRGLGDDVASVRDAAVSTVPAFSRAWRHRRPQALRELLADIRLMADDAKYSRRMIFVACQQQLLLAEDDGKLLGRDTSLWEVLERLGSDDIDGVRIGVARLLREVYDKYHKTTIQGLERIFHLARGLVQDKCGVVRSFVVPILDPASLQARPVQGYCASELSHFHKFSRPPPPIAESEQETLVDIGGVNDASLVESLVKVSSDVDVDENNGLPVRFSGTCLPFHPDGSPAIHLLSISEDTRIDNMGTTAAHSCSSPSPNEIQSEAIRTRSEQLPVVV